MSNRQFFAQIGVFLLVGVNVAAYYVFWPKGDRASALNAKGQDNLVESLKAEKKGAVPKPPEAPEPFPKPIAPASVPLTPVPPVVAREAEKDALNKLLDKIDADGPMAAPFNVEILPPIPAPLQPESPRPLRALHADPAPASGELKKTAQSSLTSMGAQVAKSQESPWLLKMDTVGNQTQLIAKGPNENLMQFKILCDRVETKAPDGVLQAVGKVTFYAAGFKGSCQRLTLSLEKMHVVFEDRVEIETTAPGSLLSSEKVVWEAPHGAGANPNDVRPATFNPSMPTPTSISR